MPRSSGDRADDDSWTPGPLVRWSGLGCMVVLGAAAVAVLVLTLVTIATRAG